MQRGLGRNRASDPVTSRDQATKGGHHEQSSQITELIWPGELSSHHKMEVVHPELDVSKKTEKKEMHEQVAQPASPYYLPLLHQQISPKSHLRQH